MINVSLLLLHNAVLSSITDTKYVFATVNELLRKRGKEQIFDVKLVGLAKEIKLYQGIVAITADAVIENTENCNLIIIPSMMGDMITSSYLNKNYAPWIIEQYKKGAEVASLCTGAFLLGFTGLLKDKECTTHWQYANEFRHFYPSVKLVDDKMITHQNGLYSSGGNNAYWNLLLYLVEKYTNREIAIHIAKFFVIDLDRNDQSPFVIFNGFKEHDDKIIKDAQEYIEKNFTEKFSVASVAERFHTGRRTFERRFKKATRNTVVEYIQRVKIEATKKQLEIGRKSINEVMYEVGYSDIKAFRDVFKRITGMTPVDYRLKYNKG